MTYPTDIDANDFPIHLDKDDVYIVYQNDKYLDFAFKNTFPLEENKVPNEQLTFAEVKSELDDYISNGWNRI